MTLANSHELQCPKCGVAQKVTVWVTINVNVDPGLRDRLFAGDINFFHCASCGHHTFVDAPLMYHDMKGQFCVQYLSPTSLDDPEQAFRLYNAEGRLDMKDPREDFHGGLIQQSPHYNPNLGAYILSPHIVFHMKEMIRYVRFREFLYDRSRRPPHGILGKFRKMVVDIFVKFKRT